MKKIQSILLAAIAATMVLTACSSDDYSYSPGEKSAGAFLTAAKSSFVYTPGQKQVLTLGLGRTEFAGAETVTLSGNHPAFKVPASVSFAAGEKAKDVEIPFALETGESAKLTVKVTSATSAYGADSVVVNVKCDYVWTSLGIGKYFDSFLFSEPNEVEILQCDAVPNMYRVVAPYTDAPYQSGIDVLYPQASEFDLTIYKAGDTYAGEVLTYDDMVGYAPIHTGTDVGYDAEVIVYHPSEGFKNHDTADTWALNKVLVYQETESNGVKIPGQVQLAPYHYMDDVGGWNHADDTSGAIIITFPGYVIKDYSIEFEYEGRQTDMFGHQDYAYGTVTLGADVASAKIAIATGATYSDVLAGLMDGTIEGVTVEQSGSVQLPGVDGTDYYYAVMVVYDENGEVVGADYSGFFFTSSKEQWTKLYDGVYTYGAGSYKVSNLQGMSFYEGTENGAVYKSTTTEGLYTIKPWANAEANFGLVFWWDTESNQLFVEGAATGDEDIYEYEGETYNDGPVVFYTLDMLGLDLPSTFNPETKTFTFNGAYLADEGWYGAIMETFVVSDAPAAPSFKLAPFAKSKHQGQKKNATFMMKRALSPVKMKQCR